MKMIAYLSLLFCFASSAVAAPTLPEAFLDAYHNYLSFYSASGFNEAVKKSPLGKEVLYGTASLPYELQNDTGRTIEDIAAQESYPLAEPEVNNIACVPTFIEAAPEVAYRGVVVLFHGFSSCPMGMYEYGAMLSKHGYHVLMPLLPGHGRGPVPYAPKGADPDWYGGFVPDHTQEQRYFDFGTFINDIVEKLPGEKTVVGISAGGPVAQWLSLERPGLYQKALILSAFYRNRPSVPPKDVIDIPRIYDPSSPPTDALFQAIANSAMEWGQWCYYSAQKGRRGICSMRGKQGLGLSRFTKALEERIIARAKEAAPWPRTQFISVENDYNSDTSVTRSMYQIQKAANPQSVSMCFFSSAVPHAFVSPYDVGRAMPWLPAFYAGSLSFIETSKSYPETAEQAKDLPADADIYHRCQEAL